MHGRAVRGGDLRRGGVPAWAAAAVALGLAALAPGCEPPPPPPDLPPAESETRAAEIVMILPGEETPLTRAWEQAARQWAGTAKAIFRSEKPTPDGPITSQADAIRAAAGRKPSALIVVADDPGAVATAAAEALRAGVAVVALGREIPGLSGRTSVVTPAPAEESARKLVAAAVEDARAAGFPEHGPAMLIIKEPDDQMPPDRAGALRKAATDAGLTIAGEVRIPDRDQPAMRRLKEAIDREPRLAILLADDDDSSNAAAILRYDPKTTSRAVLAGFVSYGTNVDLSRTGRAAAVADRNLILLARTAVDAAVDLAAGKPVPARIAPEAVFHRRLVDPKLVPGPPPGQ